MKYKISYPSGAQFSVVGKFAMLEGLGPVIQISKSMRIMEHYLNRGSVFVLDPRGVVADEDAAGTNEVIYSPRHPTWFAFAPPWAREWLAQNPDWPGILELQGEGQGPQPVWPEGDAETAPIKAPSRIQKTNSKEDDGHVDGALGTVLGSMVHGEVLAYAVEWDDMPGTPIWIRPDGIKVMP